MCLRVSGRFFCFVSLLTFLAARLHNLGPVFLLRPVLHQPKFFPWVGRGSNGSSLISKGFHGKRRNRRRGGGAGGPFDAPPQAEDCGCGAQQVRSASPLHSPSSPLQSLFLPMHTVSSLLRPISTEGQGDHLLCSFGIEPPWDQRSGLEPKSLRRVCVSKLKFS